MRVTVAILATAVASLVFAGFLTFVLFLTPEAIPGWLGVLFRLAGFLGATIIADRIVPRRALLTVAVGIGGTWGVLALWFFPPSSAIFILVYVIPSLALAFALDRWRSGTQRGAALNGQ